MERTQQMSDEALSLIKSRFKEDVKQRLEEAKKAEDLRILPAEEYQSLMPMPLGLATRHAAGEDLGIETYLMYTDPMGKRIVIALAADEEPVYVVNLDARYELPDASGQNNLPPLAQQLSSQ